MIRKGGDRDEAKPMYQSLKVLSAALVFGGVALTASAKSQAADSSCKRLAQEPCQAQGCSWVKSYKTAKGKEVAAFCRKKPERKATNAAVPPPKS
jgi:hypothetical protein